LKAKIAWGAATCSDPHDRRRDRCGKREQDQRHMRRAPELGAEESLPENQKECDQQSEQCGDDQ
jgi:hypothetical protein